MIVFDLCCGHDHRFEAWFASSASFADQQARGLIACPICGDDTVAKAAMAPRLGAKANRDAAAPPNVAAPPDAAPVPAPAAALRRMAAAIAARQAEMLPQSRWVGREFSNAARAMHEGRTPADLIHGQASPTEAQALHDDGIAVMPLLVPVVPPDTLN